MSIQVILRLDFVKKYKCVIITEQQVLHMRGHARPLQGKTTKQPQPDVGAATITTTLEHTVKLHCLVS